ncbi:hypothetical protein COE97_12710 [Bacillus toyonensis]|nr:hypothetical protein COE97_12710 [Bacillus toyonensis]
MKHHFYKTLINQCFWHDLKLDEFRGYIPHTSSPMGTRSIYVSILREKKALILRYQGFFLFYKVNFKWRKMKRNHKTATKNLQYKSILIIGMVISINLY